MQIGLIGGIGPAATDYYYRNIITSYANQDVSLDLTIVHADAPTLLVNLAAHNVDEQVAIYQRLTNRLALAGADCVVVTSIAGHFCIEEFKNTSPLPVIDMIEETNKAISKAGFSHIGILGTKTVMETKFYGGITTAEIVPPKGAQLNAVHEAYVSMAATGTVSNAQRQVFETACTNLLETQDVEAIMLGGTDLALVYNEQNSEFPIIDCAKIHCDAIVEWAMQ